MPSLRLLAAGSNAQGQLGTGSLEDAHSFTPCLFAGYPAGSLPPGTLAISQIACGANHTLALLQRQVEPDATPVSELWGCGDGRRGQLGPSYLTDVGASADKTSTAVFQKLDLQLDRTVGADSLHAYVPRLVAAGWETSYVVVSRAGCSDVLISMGADDYGDLGVGGAKGKGVMGRPVHLVDLRGLFAQHAGEAEVDGGSFTVRSLAAGPHHVVVNLETVHDHEFMQSLLVGWGAGRHGQLDGFERTPGKASPFYTVPRPIPLAPNAPAVVSIALGNQHSVFLDASGRLSGCGSNRKGQLRDLRTLANVTDVACTWNGSYLVMKDIEGWRILSTGSNNKGQLGRGDFRDASSLVGVQFQCTDHTCQLKKMACGSEHILCLLTRDAGEATQTEVWGWGWNEHGNLGLDSTEDQNRPLCIWSSASAIGTASHAVGIWCGNGTSWIAVEQ